MKKFTALLLVFALVLVCASCSKDSGGGQTSAPPASTGGTEAPPAATPAPEDAPPAEQPGEPSGSEPVAVDISQITIDQLNVGADYTDLKAELRIKTQRTDLVENGVLQKYVLDFQKKYPNIKISYEGITDYANDITLRLSTPDWGDICMMPPTVPLTELENYFHPLGKLDVLSKTYNFADAKAFAGVSYGLSSTNNAQGVLYNKKVFADAGIEGVPKTPDEFLDALQKIKDNTDAIPLYTNFAAGWTMTAWDAYIGGSATGDPNFMNQVLPHAKDPFADRGDGTGPYAVYYVLYEAVARGLVEADPATTDWESCKARINNGEIGVMVLGSWAITQMQEAGPNPDDIGYMSFPITVNGKQYASAGADYCYGVNKNIKDEAKLASMLYIKYLVEDSNFDYDQGGIPTVKSHSLPAVYAAFDGIDLLPDAPAKDGEEDLFTNINVDSEVNINADAQHVNDIVEAALKKAPSLDEIVAGWNDRWTKAQQKYGA